MVGRPAELEVRLRDLHRRGLLADDPETIVPIWHGPEWVSVDVMVRVARPVPSPVAVFLERRPWVLKLAAVSGGIALALGALIALVVYTVADLTGRAVAAVTAHPEYVALAVGAVLLPAALAVKRARACKGLHCHD